MTLSSGTGWLPRAGEVLSPESIDASSLDVPSADRPRLFSLGNDGPLLGAIILGKITVLLLVFLAYSLLPFFTANYEVNFVDPAYQEVTLASAFSTWDAQHYLYLSENGYHAGELSDAFFPLFPLLIHLVTPLFHSSLIAGLVVANLASLAGLFVLFKLVAGLCGVQTGRSMLLLYVAFPTAFFFSLVYSESLFLLLVAIFFYLLFRRRLAWAAAISMLLPLARPEGTLIVLPLAVYYGLEVLGVTRRPLDEIWAGLRINDLLPILSPFVGVAAYFTFMRVATGNALEMFDAMRGYVSAHSLGYILHPLDLLRTLAEWPLAIHGFTNSALDRALFLVFLLLLIPTFRRLHPALAVYALAIGLLNVVSGTFMSYSRYLLLAFPVFVTAAMLLQRPKLQLFRIPLACSLAMLQGLFVTMHALSYWVA